MTDIFNRQTIDSRRLLYFYHVAKNGSLSRAEAAVNAPQPVISRHIHKLEEELGLQLLDRNGRGVTLTRFGEILFRRAEPILNEMAGTIEELKVARRQPAGQVRIAAPATVMSLYMPEVIRRFMDELPDVELVAIQALTGEIYGKLISDKVDIGIVQQVPNKTKFEVHELLVEPMMAIAGKGHALFTQKSISREALAQHAMVLPSLSHGLRELIDNYMSDGNLIAKTPLQIDSVPLIREIVAQGQLVTILPKSTCHLEFDRKRFSFLTLKPTMTRSLFAAHLRDYRRAPYVEVLKRHLVDVFREKTAGFKTAA